MSLCVSSKSLCVSSKSTQDMTESGPSEWGLLYPGRTVGNDLGTYRGVVNHTEVVCTDLAVD